jgi:hypothetical protein
MQVPSENRGVAQSSQALFRETVPIVFVLQVNIILDTLNVYSGHGSIFENSAV